MVRTAFAKFLRYFGYFLLGASLIGALVLHIYFSILTFRTFSFWIAVLISFIPGIGTFAYCILMIVSANMWLPLILVSASCVVFVIAQICLYFALYFADELD